MRSETQNFALRSLVAAAESRQSHREYSEYCRLREQGLRKQALSALNRLLTAAESWTVQEKREFAAWLCGTADLLEQPKRAFSSAPHTELHGLFPDPLKRKLLEPVFKEWTTQEPQNVQAHLWRAKYLQQPDGYQKAVALEPTNQIARLALADACTYDLWFATHHLPDYFIGNENDAQSALREAYAHLDHLKSSPIKESILRDLRYYEQMIHDWIAFQTEGASDFAEWCRSRGRDYHWVRAYYYNP